MAALVAGLSVQAWGQTSKPASVPVDVSLAELVRDYFTEDDPGRRTTIAESIDAATGGDIALVSGAVGQVQLWQPRGPGRDDFHVETRVGKTRVQARLPAGYDPAQRYPLIVALHGMGGRAQHIIGYVAAHLGEASDEYIIAAPQDYKGTWFHSLPEEAGAPVALMRELLRRYHVDTERIYAVGYSMGGHGAFTLATFYTDYFASAVPLAGTLAVQYQAPTFHLLVPNWTNLPVLAVWGKHDVGDNQRDKTPGGGIAGHNKILRIVAGQHAMPLKAIELADKGHRDVDPPDDLFLEYLQKRRDPAPKTVYHTFRYHEQGRISWLRQRRFAGKPWDGQSIAIVVTGPTDTDQYVTDVLTKKLAHIGGTIDGQTINVDIRRTAELEVLLNDDLVNLDQPIKLLVDETVRYEGKVERRVATLLDVAYQDWDFQRLYPVRLVMKARSPARQE